MIGAAIDIGTNSTRLYIADIGKNIRRIEKQTKVTRLGKGVDKEKIISREAMDRNIEVLKDYVKIASSYGVDHITAIATSAVRDAANREEFILYVKENTGIDVNVISGKEEAELGFIGASSMISGKNSVIIDIGGGSTEFILGEKGKLVYSNSINIGAVRLTERFSESGGFNRILAEDFIRSEIKDTIEIVREHGSMPVIGVGGTVTTLAAMDQNLRVYNIDKVHGYVLQFHKVTYILNELLSLPVESRKLLPGLQPERADIIPSGTLILKIIMEMLECPEITISEADNLDGIVIRYCGQVNNQH